MPVLVASAGAQPLAMTSVVGSIAVSATVLPLASFDGGAVRTLSILLVPGDSARVEPQAGIRTRMTHSAPVRVTVRATRFAGPGGRVVAPRLLCAHGRAGAPLPDVPFDCATGYSASMAGAGVSTVALGIGALVSARETRGLPAGVYTGTVTLLASSPGS